MNKSKKTKVSVEDIIKIIDENYYHNSSYPSYEGRNLRSATAIHRLLSTKGEKK